MDKLCKTAEFNFIVQPVVTTRAPLHVTSDSAICGGNVLSDGGSPVTARGVCWSTSPDPTVADSHTTDGSGVGPFTSSITGLTPDTIYYARAYAVNSGYTVYGANVSFSTGFFQIPTLNEWGRILFSLLVCVTAILMMRRNRRGRQKR